MTHDPVLEAKPSRLDAHEAKEPVMKDAASDSAAPPDVSGPLVSVIVPAYNAAGYITDALESVLSQTFTSYELIVINDGSPDTEELERVLAPYEEKIVYLKQENRGPSAARNCGIAHARGKYVALLDSDDMWFPELLAEQVGFLEAHPQFDVVSSGVEFFGDRPHRSRNAMSGHVSGEVDLEGLLALRRKVCTSSVVMKREPLLRVGMFDEAHGMRSEDFELWLRLAKSGVRFACQNRPLVRYRYRNGSLSSDRTELYDGAMRALDKLEAAGGLSTREFAALTNTRRQLHTDKHTEAGKRHLASGEYAEAARAFRIANMYRNSLKLRCVLFGLMLLPAATRRLYLLTQ
jgi:glycosyltransferase involved in cell wall biosynthesis